MYLLPVLQYTGDKKDRKHSLFHNKYFHEMNCDKLCRESIGVSRGNHYSSSQTVQYISRPVAKIWYLACEHPWLMHYSKCLIHVPGCGRSIVAPRNHTQVVCASVITIMHIELMNLVRFWYWYLVW